MDLKTEGSTSYTGTVEEISGISAPRRLKTLTIARPLRCASSRSLGPSTGSRPSRVRVPWSRALRMSMSLGLCLPNERVSTDNFGSHGRVPNGSYFRNGLRYDFNGFAPWWRDRFSYRHRLRTRCRPVQRIGHHTHFRNQAARRNKTNSATCGFYPNGGIRESAIASVLFTGRTFLARTTDGCSPSGLFSFRKSYGRYRDHWLEIACS